MSHRLFVLLLLASGCAGPSAHQSVAQGSALDPHQQEVKRAPVASTLTPEDPLAAPSCLGTECPAEAPEQKPQPHEHHHESSVTAPEPEAEMADAKVTDPMCKMKIDPKTAGGGSLTFEGNQHFFCSSSCQRNFLTQHPGAQ